MYALVLLAAAVLIAAAFALISRGKRRASAAETLTARPSPMRAALERRMRDGELDV